MIDHGRSSRWSQGTLFQIRKEERLLRRIPFEILEFFVRNQYLQQGDREHIRNNLRRIIEKGEYSMELKYLAISNIGPFKGLHQFDFNTKSGKTGFAIFSKMEEENFLV